MDVSNKFTTKLHTKYQKPFIFKMTGLTLVELLVTLAISTAVFSYAVPQYHSISKLNQSAVTVNKLVSDLAFARNESIKRARDVVICKSTNGINCAIAKGWQGGWIIFVDSENRDKQRSSGEPILKVQQVLGTNLKVIFTSFNSKNKIVYRPSGAADYSNGTFRFCTNNEQYHKDLILSRTGRTYLKTNAGKIYAKSDVC
ncbi:hypothetical protein MNBD_GAMMA22-820 [hydrothermal vent metagenome]|uniref:General secretion pathway GspH domain-containing protein n=1 Tax=hydrothermal vent metagenome TaxID=652676 RepID=A0A3B0ZPS7_9ZZZZ